MIHFLFVSLVLSLWLLRTPLIHAQLIFDQRSPLYISTGLDVINNGSSESLQTFSVTYEPVELGQVLPSEILSASLTPTQIPPTPTPTEIPPSPTPIPTIVFVEPSPFEEYETDIVAFSEYIASASSALPSAQGEEDRYAQLEERMFLLEDQVHRMNTMLETILDLLKVFIPDTEPSE